MSSNQLLGRNILQKKPWSDLQTDQVDSDELTGLVFIDFRKAFDVIDHELLLNKFFYQRGLSLFRRLV